MCSLLKNTYLLHVVGTFVWYSVSTLAKEIETGSQYQN